MMKGIVCIFVLAFFFCVYAEESGDFYQQGLSFFIGGNYVRAEEAFLKSFARKESPYTSHYLGICCEKQGKLSEARTWYERTVLLQQKNNAVPRMSESEKTQSLESFSAAGKTDTELKLSDYSLINNENTPVEPIKNIIPEVLSALAVVERNIGEDKAMISYVSALNSDNSDVEALNNLAWLLASQNVYLKEAEIFAKQAYKISDEFYCLDTLGFIYEKMNQYENAVLCYGKIVAELEETYVHNTDDQYYYKLAYSLFKIQRFEKSFSMLNEAIKLNSKNLDKAKKDGIFEKLADFFESRDENER